MIVLALLAAAPATLHFGDPIGNMPEWIRDSDNDKAQARGKVLFKVIFNLEGKPDRCIIVEREGDPAVERLACDAIYKRFRFKPSTGPDAQPTYLIFQKSAVYSLQQPGGPSLKTPPLIVDDTTGMLSDRASARRLALAVAVDRTGSIAKCGPTQATKGKDVAVAEAACRSLPASWRPAPEVNADGQPIAYLRGFEIEFRPTSKQGQ
jgi:hypothetical protein